MARQTFYAESLTEQNTTSTTYVDACTLTETFDASSNYLLLANGFLGGSNTSGDGFIRFENTSDTVTYGLNEYEPKEAGTAADSNRKSFASMGILTTGGSAVSKTVKIQYQTVAATTAYVRNCRILALKLDAADQYVEELGDDTTTSSTYSDIGAGLTFTPATSGDYLIIACCDYVMSSTTQSAFHRLNVTGTTYNEQEFESFGTTNQHNYITLIRLNLAASSQTIKLEHRRESTLGTLTSRRARIAALRLDGFNNNYYARTATGSGATNTTYADHNTLIQTPEATEHIILSSWSQNIVSTSITGYGNLIQDSTTFAENIEEATDTTNYATAFGMSRQTLTAVSTTWKNQRRSESAAAVTNMRDAAISVIQTGDAPAPSPSSLPPGSLAMMGYGI